MLNSNLQLKKQFDYASLIDKRQSLEQLNSSQQSLKASLKQSNESVRHQETFRQDAENRPSMKDHLAASLDQLITEDEKIAERLQAQHERQGSDEHP